MGAWGSPGAWGGALSVWTGDGGWVEEQGLMLL